MPDSGRTSTTTNDAWRARTSWTSMPSLVLHSSEAGKATTGGIDKVHRAEQQTRADCPSSQSHTRAGVKPSPLASCSDSLLCARRPSGRPLQSLARFASSSALRKDTTSDPDNSLYRHRPVIQPVEQHRCSLSLTRRRQARSRTRGVHEERVPRYGTASTLTRASA